MAASDDLEPDCARGSNGGFCVRLARPAGADCYGWKFYLRLHREKHMEKIATNGILIALIAEETGVPLADVTLDTKLEDLGVDSLDFLDLMQVIGEKFKPIPEAQFAELNTVGDIAKALQ